MNCCNGAAEGRERNEDAAGRTPEAASGGAKAADGARSVDRPRKTPAAASGGAKAADGASDSPMKTSWKGAAAMVMRPITRGQLLKLPIGRLIPALLSEPGRLRSRPSLMTLRSHRGPQELSIDRRLLDRLGCWLGPGAPPGSRSAASPGHSARCRPCGPLPAAWKQGTKGNLLAEQRPARRCVSP